MQLLLWRAPPDMRVITRGVDSIGENNIGDAGTVAIAGALAFNTCLEKLECVECACGVGFACGQTLPQRHEAGSSAGWMMGSGVGL